MDNVLLIEDNLADIVLIQAYLQDVAFTHRLFKAKSLQEGIDLIHHNPIDIVLLDLALDDSAGYNTLRMFLQEVPNVPVIVLTGMSSEVLGMQIVRAGAQDYLVKGNFEGKQLARAIRHSIKRFKAQVEVREELREVKRREKRNHLLHQAVKLGIWELDLLDNRMSWSNDMFTLLGYPANNFEPQLSDLLRVVHRDDQEKVKSFFQEAVRQTKLSQLEHRALVNNRQLQYFFLKAQVISDEQSGRLMLVGTLQDVTDFKINTNGVLSDNSKNSNATENQLVGATRLRSLLDQLLQIIRDLEIGLTQKHKEKLKTAKQVAAEMLQTLYGQINQLVAQCTTVPLQSDTFDFSIWQNYINVLLELSASQLIPPVKLNWEHHLPKQVTADEHLISLLFYNVIQNAAQLHEAKDTLQIAISVGQSKNGQASLHLLIEPPQLPASLIRRKNCRMHLQELLDHRSTKSDPALGLVVLAKIIQTLGTSLHVSKEEAWDLAVPIQLPAGKNGVVTQPIRMLIVEHQTIIQIALKRILHAGFSNIALDFAEDLDGGEQQLSQKDYDLVIVDVQSPHNEAATMIDTLKNTKDTVLMALASNFSEQDETQLRRLGVKAFVTKPPQRDALIKSVQKVLQRKNGSLHEG